MKKLLSTALLTLGLLQTSILSATDLNSRLVVYLNGSNIEAKSNYLTYYMMQLQDTQNGTLSSNYELIKPTSKAIDFDLVDYSGEWNGIFPDVDFSFPTKNFNDSTIDISNLDPSWQNSDVLVKSASISALGRKFKTTGTLDKNDAILMIYNFLNLVEVSASAVGDVSGIGDTSKYSESIKVFADKVEKYQDSMHDMALYMGILNVTLKQVENIVSLVNVDDPVFDSIANSAQNTQAIMQKLIDIQGMSLGSTQEYENYSTLILQNKYQELLKSYKVTLQDNSLSSLNNAFKELYDSSNSDEQVKLLAKYAIEPLSELLGAYQEKLEQDLKDSRVEVQREALQREISFLKNGKAVLLLASLFVASDDYIAMAKDEPEKLIPFFMQIAKDITASLATIENAQAVASNFNTKFNVVDKKAIGKGSAYMKAFVAGSNIGNSLLPMLWDMTLAPAEFHFSIIDAAISKYGASHSKVLIKELNATSEMTLASFTNEVDKQNGVIEVATGATIKVLSDISQDSLFDQDRAPWIVNSTVAPAPIYSILTTSPQKYTQDALCVRKVLFFDTNFVPYSDAGTSWSIPERLCGAGTILGDGWYDNIPSNTLYSEATLLQKYKLQSLADDTQTDTDFLSKHEFVYDGKVTTLLVQISGNYINDITHRITLVPKVEVPQTVLATTSMDASVDLTSIVSSLEDPIIEYNIDWGDGEKTLGLSTPELLTHTYSSEGNYTVVLNIITQNGLDKDVTAELSVMANTQPTAQNQNIIVTQDSTDNTITLVGTDVDGDTLSYSFTQPSHGVLSGTPPNLTYTPIADYTGADSFIYTINDGIVDSTEAKIDIIVLVPEQGTITHNGLLYGTITSAQTGRLWLEIYI
jgi:hypothetical protein